MVASVTQKNTVTQFISTLQSVLTTTSDEAVQKDHSINTALSLALSPSASCNSSNSSSCGCGCDSNCDHNSLNLDLSTIASQSYDSLQQWAQATPEQLYSLVLEELSSQQQSGNAVMGLQAPQIMLCLEHLSLSELTSLCHEITARFAPRKVSLCSITNVKSGRCSEDCKWCAQSKFYDTKAEVYDVKSGEVCRAEAQHCYEQGVEMFSFVASGRKQSPKELRELFATIDEVHHNVPIGLCASLGLLGLAELQELKAHGVTRYHCNLETAPSYFAQLCSRHQQQDKIATLKAAKAAGLDLCSGGIIGMGETELQRLELALTLQQLHISSIPINVLHPIAGTPLEHQAPLSATAILRAVCIFRLANATAHLRFAGGRALLSQELINAAIYSGMNAAIVGDLLTTLGSDIATDRQRFSEHHYDLPPIPVVVSTAQDKSTANVVTESANVVTEEEEEEVDAVDTADTAASIEADTAALAAVERTVATLKTPEQMAERLRTLGDDFDREHLWHPYTSALEPTPACKVVRSYGRTLELTDGTTLLDGISSWWCCVHGYGIESITKAAQKQVAELSHVMFAGFTHEPAIALGKRLLSMIPCMDHIFYSDSGSVAVEVALKMALQYQHARGCSHKTNFLTVHAGYHGDTWNAMSVCEPQGMHTVFGAALPQRYFAANPQTPFHGSIVGQPERGAHFAPDDLNTMAEHLAQHDDIAAVILEPIVQGANGMYFYHPEYLNQLRSLCDQYGVLLIFDEIATGFGRSGKLFAYEYTNIHPDLMLIGKGLTAGYMTLAATLCTAQVAQVISQHEPQVFMHGPTFMANPLACAIGCASLDYLQSYDYLGQAHALEQGFKKGLHPALRYPCVKEIRVLGAIAAIELTEPLSPAVASAYALQLGVWLRPMGNLLYAMPPLTMTAEEQASLIHAMLCLVHVHKQRLAAKQ